jgi:hypothetical protein
MARDLFLVVQGRHTRAEQIGSHGVARYYTIACVSGGDVVAVGCPISEPEDVRHPEHVAEHS